MMNESDHLKKAERLDRTIKELNPEKDFETIVEVCYGAFIHFAAVLCQRHYGEHRDIHKGLPKYLNERGETELASLFREIDTLREARWYGGQNDGEAARRAIEILEDVKRRVYEG
jgi:hypothetical protein